MKICVFWQRCEQLFIWDTRNYTNWNSNHYNRSFEIIFYAVELTFIVSNCRWLRFQKEKNCREKRIFTYFNVRVSKEKSGGQSHNLSIEIVERIDTSNLNNRAYYHICWALLKTCRKNSMKYLIAYKNIYFKFILKNVQLTKIHSIKIHHSFIDMKTI